MKPKSKNNLSTYTTTDAEGQTYQIKDCPTHSERLRITIDGKEIILTRGGAYDLQIILEYFYHTGYVAMYSKWGHDYPSTTVIDELRKGHFRGERHQTIP